MTKRDCTPEEIKKTLLAMLDCKGGAMGISRGTVQGALDYILLMENRLDMVMTVSEDKCVFCAYEQGEKGCDDSTDGAYESCPHTACPCRMDTDNICQGFAWRDDL